MTGHIDKDSFFHSSSKGFQHKLGIAGLLFAFTEKYDFIYWHFSRYHWWTSNFTPCALSDLYFGKKTLKPDKKISLKRTLGKKQPTLVQKPEMVPILLDGGIRMSSPQKGDVFHRGGSISINYRFSRVVDAVGDIVFSLRLDENGDEVVSTTVENTDPNLPPGAFHEVVLVVPGDVSYGEYHILASHSASGAEGECDVF